MSCAQYLNILGLIINAAGVVLLFRYGMPFRIAAEGQFIITETRPQTDVDADDRYRRLGYLGLALIIVGTGAQIASTIMQ